MSGDVSHRMCPLLPSNYIVWRSTVLCLLYSHSIESLRLICKQKHSKPAQKGGKFPISESHLPLLFFLRFNPNFSSTFLYGIPSVKLLLKNAYRLEDRKTAKLYELDHWGRVSFDKLIVAHLVKKLLWRLWGFETWHRTVCYTDTKLKKTKQVNAAATLYTCVQVTAVYNHVWTHRPSWLGLPHCSLHSPHEWQDATSIIPSSIFQILFHSSTLKNELHIVWVSKSGLKNTHVVTLQIIYLYIIYNKTTYYT